MIIFIYGDDNYSSRRYLDRVIDKFKQKHDTSGENILVFDSEDCQWDRIVSAITGRGLFSSKKLIVLKDIFAVKESRESLNEFLGAHILSDDVSLIIYESESVDKRSALFKRLNKEKYVYEFLMPDARMVEINIARMASDLGKKIDSQAARELSVICGTNLWRAKSEIEKLACLSVGVITVNEIRQNTRGKLEHDIWQFVDSISASNKSKALNMLESQLESNVEPMYLLSMIIRQFRLLICLHNAQGEDAVISKSLSLHPFVVKKTRQQSKNFSIEKLRLIYQSLFRMDNAIKTSKSDPKVLFTVLVDSIIL